jgi:hypothetical protein
VTGAGRLDGARREPRDERIQRPFVAAVLVLGESTFIHALHAAGAAGAAVAVVGALLAVVYLGGRLERTVRLEPAVAAVSA